MNHPVALALALPLAWGLDAWFGEPPNRWHPVAWLGRVLGPWGRCASAWRPVAAFVGGALAWCAGVAALGAAAAWVEAVVLHALPWPAAAVLLALLLKPCFAWRMLRDEVGAVETALVQQGLPAARGRLARLVSRDVQGLDEGAVRETAIETLAENLSDSVVAPLAWFALLGLPGAVAYRFANTADAMWGYRGRYEWAGKWAARADDLLSWAPARLTAALLLPRRAAAWRALPVEAARTPSPNGGWPMGAMALRLGVGLGKPGVYRLNPAAPAPGAADLRRALRGAGTAAWAAAGLATLAVALRSAPW
ncbi:adenosylcobinamide-phosphate synthase CbiB [Ideonella sp.]|uniref:adenosylcobinamide-phosphate synthase CbiB n=1 Tax=Ideonella sp. TaxID=1929293 RepID=UPI002B49CDD7|nr:adenosylcobinamide-phosphate synthase CbiB [Ideonella sp.]HJV70102.1 adenosylcobinamide-phosphate synthase CbiB [Ideonella sp.]